MKKLTVITAIAMTAGLLQAATFNWSTSASLNSLTPNPPGDGYTSENTSFQLVFFGATEPVVGGNFDWNNVTDDPTMGTEVAWSGGSYNYALGTAAFSYSAPEASINGWYGVVILDAATPSYYGFNKFEVSGLTDQSAAPEFNTGGSTDASGFQAVPEPTSMALIGIGAAAIALRKRFGKKA